MTLTVDLQQCIAQHPSATNILSRHAAKHQEFVLMNIEIARNVHIDYRFLDHLDNIL